MAFVTSVVPCGPSYITPIFDYTYAPENPFENFAAGKIGILKPDYHRSVLFAAYRYFNNGSFTADEQKALVEVWNAEFNNKDYRDDSVEEAVKAWVKERKDIVGKEEKTPEIYVERDYGGYDFFPNCTKSAFETATLTLKDRSASYGSDDKDVKNWIAAQDKVFTNCSSGKQTPDAADASMPEWLQKDRAYQLAAAAFYSLDYAEARRRFEEIAQDYASPWQQTADYLVGRTMIRQASLSKDIAKSDRLYSEAENYLYRLATGGNKYSDSAASLLGLVKYRLHPEQRIHELAQTLSYQGDAAQFRQNLIDYTWLLDKFEKEALEKEDKRKEALKPKDANANSMESNANAMTEINTSASSRPHDEGDLEITVYTEDYQKSWTIYVKPEATDDDAIAAAEKVVDVPLTDKMKEQIRFARQSAYSNRYADNRDNGYEGGYNGEEKNSLSILPKSLRSDDLTDWLYTYQIKDAEAYLYSLNRFKQNDSDLWLATAISKAEASSSELNRLLDAANRINNSSPAYSTVQYHRARLLLALNKRTEAKKLLDDVLSSSADMPISTRNQFLELRMKVSDTLDDFLKYAQRKPFAFDFEGQGMTIDEIIAERKSWYDPTYDKQTKEEYDADIEKQFGGEGLWQDRFMFDDKTANIINRHFPLEVLAEAEKSTALPDYLRERFALNVFVRAILLQDEPMIRKIAPEVVKFKPELAEQITKFLSAPPNDRARAALYLILKNETFTPYMSGGIGTPNDQVSYATRWWCQPGEVLYDEKTGEEIPWSSIPKPSFLTKEQSLAAQAEMKKLRDIGDAPKYLGEKVLAWAKLAPNDKRIPESLYIVYDSNDYDKYGCGGVIELRNAAAKLLKTRYPNSEWTRQIVEEPAEQ